MLIMMFEQNTSFYPTCHKYIENVAKKRLQALTCNVLLLGESRKLAVHAAHAYRAQRKEQRPRIHS